MSLSRRDLLQATALGVALGVLGCRCEWRGATE